jgi:DnaK suppressor protein
MDRKDLDRYKRALLEKRGQMSIASAEAESPIPAAGHQQGDPVDQANANAEAELQIHLHQTDVRLLRAIEDAFARINHGTYGVCTVCKQPISKARLNAVPWTHLCRECKEREHRERSVRKETR